MYFFLIVWESQIFSLWTQRCRIYEEMLYESGPISLLSEIYPHSSEMQPSTFNKKKPPLWILNFIHFNLPFLSTQIQTYSTCFVKTLIDLWKLHLICENSNFTYWVIFCVNSWQFYPSPKMFYKSAIRDKFHVCFSDHVLGPPLITWNTHCRKTFFEDQNLHCLHWLTCGGNVHTVMTSVWRGVGTD